MYKKLAVFLITCLHTLSWGGVYTVGNQNDGAHDIATLWITNPIGNVTSKTIGILDKDSAAESVIVYNHNIYIVGTQNDGNHNVATLWICDELGNLVSAKPLGISNKTSYATGIAVLNNNFYIPGLQNDGTHDIATLWICDELGNLVSANPLGISNKNSNASAITSLNQTIYIVGKQNNGSVDVATLWVYKRLSDSISSQPLENDQNDSNASSIVAYNQQLYVSGVVSENEKPIALLWIADQQGSVLDHTRLENDLDSSTTNITSYNNTLVISGYAIIQRVPLPTYQTLVWTIDPIGTVQKSAVVGASSTAPKIYALNASNGILAVGAEIVSNQKSIATMWKITSSGKILKTITLGSPNTSSNCKGIYCSPTSSSVFQKFSPIHYQLGL